jgi:hypothetical protein
MCVLEVGTVRLQGDGLQCLGFRDEGVYLGLDCGNELGPVVGGGVEGLAGVDLFAVGVVWCIVSML